MARDVGEAIGNALGALAREATESVSNQGRNGALRNGGGPLSEIDLSGMRGVAAGAALATAAPLAAKGASKIVKSAAIKRLALSASSGDGLGGKLAEGVKKSVGDGVKGAVSGKKLVPGLGGGSNRKNKKQKNEATGAGKGRRMPVQQGVDVAVPLSTAYNQWTQFEEWPQFMHRFERVTQEDDTTVSFKTKIWGISREFEAQIDEQRPDERIKWSSTQGTTHTGVVTFHPLGDRLTRVQVSLDLEPGSLLEKAGRGMRHLKRAVRADMSRFKAFIELQEEESGAWRGVIKDGEVVKRSSAGARRRSSSRTRGGSSRGTTSRSRSSSRRTSSRRRSGSSSGQQGSGSSSRRRRTSARS
jgi:uncharacterized membrane protein